MGTAAELNRFLAEVEKRAYAMTVLAVKNPDDAMDIVQDAMFTLARKYARKAPAEWPPLFFRILRNRTTDHHRRAQVRERVLKFFGRGEDDPVEHAPAPPQASPDVGSVHADFVQGLQSALAELPPRQREAFVLRAWQGLDVQETARAMSVSSGSVKTHYSRAVGALRDKLGAFQHD